MRSLSNKEIEEIKNDLKQMGLKLHVLKDEILDHLLCMIEIGLEEGKSFELAKTDALKSFSTNDIKLTQKKTKWIYRSRELKRRAKSVASIAAVFMILLVDSVGAQNIPDGHPIDGECELSSKFGYRTDSIHHISRMHYGVDFKAKLGTPVVATADGVVEEAKSSDTGYGNKLVLSHENGYKTLFGHLLRFQVSEGDDVKKGDVIAFVGNSGKSTGPHLHYEVFIKGKRINPSTIMSK